MMNFYKIMAICFWIFFIIVDFEKKTFISAASDFTVPDYDYHWTKRPDLGDRLALKFSSKNKNDAIMHNFKRHIANDTEYFDDIPHFEINSTRKIKHKAAEFEKEFKSIIGMKGVTYTYKRDMHWRTWREVTYSNKTKEVFCYRCNNIIKENQTNCTFCHVGGYWVLEDQPPSCSYEILSFKDGNKLCVANYWQFKNKSLPSCPFTIAYQELSFCEIPLLTRLRVTPDYSRKVSKRASNVICKGREECEFSTLYNITSAAIAFRIINSTDDIIYSRLMKNNGNIYVCIDDCGKIDLNTMRTRRADNHVILNLLKYTSKKKRENKSKMSRKIVESKMNNLKRYLFARRRKFILEQPFQALYSPITTTLSLCKQMAYRQTTDYIIDYNY